MSPPTVRLRPASTTDADTLWGWRNDPDTRRASWRDEEIPLPAHTRWLEETLRRADRRLYVAEVDGVEVGTVRLDLAGTVAEVSITVAREWRGRGIASRLLEALSREACTALGLRRLVARIKSENRASRAAFERAGFSAVEDGLVVTMVREIARGRTGAS